jgi:general secretion pathway protein H
MTWRSDGFTLVELLIVLAIMAGATTMFMTYLHTGTTGAELREATREMTAALNETRSRAIGGNRVTTLIIDPAAGRYREPGHEHRLSQHVSLSVRGIVPVAPDGQTGAIYFFPDGSSSGGEIDFAAGSASEAVTVEWFTGHATAQSIHGAR